MNGELEKWRLFALLPQDISPEESESERFCRRTAGYVLVYRREEWGPRAMEVAGDNLRRLSAGDRAWLRDCNLVILAEECGKKSGEVARSLGDMVTALESALADQAEREGEENGTAD